MSYTYKGIAASPGVAIAPARVVDVRSPATTSPVMACADTPEKEWLAFEAALQAGRKDLEALRDKMLTELGGLKAEIFEAHLSILKDPELAAEVRRQIFEGKLSAADAVRRAVGDFVELLSQVEDELFAARIDDLRDIGKRLTGHLETKPCSDAFCLEQAAVVVAFDLTPSETAQLDRRLTMGFVTADGSAVSHSSILARSLGIPAVVGAADAVRYVQDGATVVVDGSSGLVIIDPEPAELALYRAKLAEFQAGRQAMALWADKPSRTRDGRQLELSANIGGTGDLQAADAGGADGVGLFRTEFMYMDRACLPGEEEQIAVYKHVLERMSPRPVIIRTLDVGGDKQLECLPMPCEANPFLGVRALRLCLANEGLFRTQLRALLRASVYGRLRIMFPMVAIVDELRAAKAILAEERTSLLAAGFAVADNIEVGVMIEIPAAALCADQLAKECDFFSIGSNDLTQYTMAADRMNPAVAYLNQASHPAVLKLVAMAAAAAARQGKWTGVCGEMAGDPLCAPLLLGLGVSELSMGSAAIPQIRKVLSMVDSAQAARLAQAALAMDSAQAVREMMEGALCEEQNHNHF